MYTLAMSSAQTAREREKRKVFRVSTAEKVENDNEKEQGRHEYISVPGGRH